MGQRYRVGDKIVYLCEQHTKQPAPHAKHVFAERRGELYQYQIASYATVVRVWANERLEVEADSGELRVIGTNDPCLRRANWIERLFLARRFPAIRRESSLVLDKSKRSRQFQ